MKKRLKYIRTTNSRSEKKNLFRPFKLIWNMKFVYRYCGFYYKGYYVNMEKIYVHFGEEQHIASANVISKTLTL